MKTTDKIIELHFKDIENFSIKFAVWISKNGYEKIYRQKKGWCDTFEIENHIFETSKRYTIKNLYDKFMIDFLCS
jgi:hypothetical protein